MKADVSSYNANIASANRTLSQFKQANLTASGVINQLTKSLTTAAAGYLGLASAGSAIAGLVKESVELAKAGEGIRIAFQKLNRPDLLNGLREATHGTVTDIELMKSAVKFNDFKLPLDQLGTMLAFAQQKAKDTGQSVDYMVDSIVTGLGRKSLMILDNLGISATEVKEKMKQTGDMTKAVGEIIREQMAKAGEYVETAADRALQANVSVQNKMEELGRKFAPVQEASSQLWTSMKLGILDIIGGPLTTLLNMLTEAGRLRMTLDNAGGSGKVGRLLGNLSGAAEGSRQQMYDNQVAEFWRYINRRENYMKNRQRWVDNQGDEGLRQQLLSEQRAFGTSNVGEIQRQINAAKIMLNDYRKGAQGILNPSAQTILPPVITGGGGGSRSTKTEPTYAADSIAAQQKLVADLTKQWNEAGAEVRNQYIQPLVEAEAKLKAMTDEQTLLKEQASGRLKGNAPGGNGIEIPVSSDVSFETWLTGVQDQLANLKFEPIEIPIETTTNDVKAIAQAASITADVVGSIGDAFSAIEDPAAKVMGTVAQAIASVAMGYAQATVAAAQTGNPWVWAAFAMSGLATMITMISNIHSATGYAEGGIVGGTSYSGDNIPIMANAGELVLTKAQQNTLAQNLQGGGMGSMNLKTKVKGTELLVWLDNSLAQSGRGELVTWGT